MNFKLGFPARVLTDKPLRPLLSFLMIHCLVLFGWRKVGGVRSNPLEEESGISGRVCSCSAGHLPPWLWAFRETQIKQNLQQPWPFPKSIHGPMPTAPEPFRNVEGLSCAVSGNMLTEIIGPAASSSTWLRGSPGVPCWPEISSTVQPKAQITV